MKTTNQKFNECAHAYGLYDGMYALTQLPYLSRDFSSGREEACYEAHAIDMDDTEYRITWDIKDDFDGEDEGEACDWEEFYVRQIYINN